MFLIPLPSCVLKPLVPASPSPAPPRSPLTPHGRHWAAASLHHPTRRQHCLRGAPPLTRDGAPRPGSPPAPGPRSSLQCGGDPAQSWTLSCLNCLSIPSQSHGFQHHPDAPQACWPRLPAGHPQRPQAQQPPPRLCIPPQPAVSSCWQLGLSSCSDQRPWGCQDPSFPHIPNAQNIFSTEV